jgi:NUMOD4 motif.
MEKIIQGFEDYTINEEGEVYSLKNKKTLKHLKNNGYMVLSLCKDKKVYKRLVHRLLAIEFIPNPNDYPSINHINGIRHDNRLENLEWCTQKQNVQHAWDTGLNRNSEKQRNAASITGKKAYKKAVEFRKKIVINTETGIYYSSAREAANAFNICYSTLKSKLNGARINDTPLKYA